MAMNLEVFSTKLKKSTKKRMEALVAANDCYRGQRELIEDMLSFYEEANPEAVEKADKLEKVLGE